jgi:hypothetical protein
MSEYMDGVWCGASVPRAARQTAWGARSSTARLVAKASYDTLSLDGFLNGRLAFIYPGLRGLMLGADFNTTEQITDDCRLGLLLNPDGSPVTDLAGQPFAVWY